MKFAFPALKKALKAREEKIRGDLEGAEQARAGGRGRARAVPGAARRRTRRGEPDRRGGPRRPPSASAARSIAKAEAEAAEIRDRAQEDIRLARERAMADLRAQVADLSIELAEKIVERNLDRDTQVALDRELHQLGRERTR